MRHLRLFCEVQMRLFCEVHLRLFCEVHLFFLGLSEAVLGKPKGQDRGLL